MTSSADEKAVVVENNSLARAIEQGFNKYRYQFEQISAGAKHRFEQADWHGMQLAGMDRVDLYDESVTQMVDQLRGMTGNGIDSLDKWTGIKLSYSRLVVSRTDGELAETYFNSIYCRLFKHLDMDSGRLFIHSSLPGDWDPPKTGICNRYELNGNFRRVVSKILDDYAFDIPYENKTRDLRNIVRFVIRYPFDGVLREKGAYLEIIKTVFYRSKAAYIVGRAVSADDGHSMPFIIPILNNEEGGVYVDTLILEPDDVSIIFSFSRSYFMVEAPIPVEYVRFLQSLLPHKQLYELYSSFGWFKHGKTVLYRDFLDHMSKTDDKFIIAPGIKGMVMTVFTLPSLETVFKIIKDRFAPPKEMTRETVKEKYRLVKRHDKAGRMADTQEFSYLRIDKHRFSEELLEELLEVASSTVEVQGDMVVIKHLWTERRMTPLNIYIENATEVEIRGAISEYGNAIRQLAAANIFPGDMLFKNFGVTRHGRVVFYDYDEICYLTECNFRKIPPPRYPEDELAGEPWYSIGPNDVFPEEFSIFLAGRAEVRKVFNEYHREIFDVNYWKGLQDAIKEGEVVDVFPYRRKKRFIRE